MSTRIDGTRIEIDGADVIDFFGHSASEVKFAMEANGEYLRASIIFPGETRLTFPLPLIAVCDLHDWTGRMGLQFSREILDAKEATNAPKG